MSLKRQLKAILKNWVFRLTITVVIIMALATILPEKVKKMENNSVETKEHVFLLILIMTGPKNSDRRQAMRETWLQNTNEDVKHYFVIGTNGLTSEIHNELSNEQKLYQDLLLFGQFEDGYAKLTEKLGLMLEWAHEIMKFKFMLKVDDDTFVRLDRILDDLKNDVDKYQPQYLYWGYFYGRSHVKQSGPWKEVNWKLCDYYLPYARGGGYVLSYNIVQYIAKNWRLFEQYLSEDVTLGAWVAPLKLTRLHDIRFDTEYKTRGCKNSFIVCHKQSIRDMKEKHRSLKETGNLCEKETNIFYGYNYNWSVPPSKCCLRSQSIP
uniref:Hexosyltransferase n=2 Tax=Ciona savignyi TaxID=51511 RepID=Q256Z8_CIOSA|nr:beta-1,3-galactosyltransferase 6 [Ciona savignyi]